MSPPVPILLLLALGLIADGASAQDKPGAIVPAKLEGKMLRKVNPDDALLLGVIAHGLLYQAQKGDKLTPEQTALSAVTMKAFIGKDMDSAYRLAPRWIQLRQGRELSEATELATSYDFRLDRKLTAPGDTIAILLEPLFTLGQPLAKPYTVKLTVRSAKGEVLRTLPPVIIKEVADLKTTFTTKDLGPGRYAVHYELVAPDGASLVTCDREFLVSTELQPRMAALHKKLDQIRQAKPAEQSIQHLAAVETIAYAVELFERATKEYVATIISSSRPMTIKLRGGNLARYDSEPFDADRDLGLAESLATDLLAGKNPLATRTGDLHLAYRSTADNTLV